MPILKKAFEETGFKGVVTYINSGNILFNSDIKDTTELIGRSEKIIKNTFQLNVPVLVMNIKELRTALEYAPEWWGNKDKEIFHNAVFLIPPISIEEVFTAVGEIKPEYEQIDYYGNVIFWSASRKDFNKARWSKIANSSVNHKVTIRTSNTVSKMIELAK